MASRRRPWLFGGRARLGNANELGHTFWQAVDAEAVSAVAAQGMKYAFRRARRTGAERVVHERWRQLPTRRSNRAGELRHAAYRERHYPWVWALELLPACDAVARMRAQAHWLADVLAGLGAGHRSRLPGDHMGDAHFRSDSSARPDRELAGYAEAHRGSAIRRGKRCGCACRNASRWTLRKR